MSGPAITDMEQGVPPAPGGVRSSVRERLVTGSFYSFAAIVAGQVFALLTSVIMARLLGAENLGLLAVYMQIASLAVGITTVGLAVPVAKFTSQLRGHEDDRLERFLSTVLATALAVSLAATIAFFIGANSIGLSLYGSGEMVLMIEIMAAFLVLNALSAFGSAVLQGLQAFRLLSMLGIFIEGLSVPVMFLFLSGFGIVGAVLAGVVVLIVGTTLTFGLAWHRLRREGIRLSVAADRASMRLFLLFTAPLLASSVVLHLAGVVQNSYLALKLGFVDVGLFKVSLTLYRVVLFVPSAMSVPLLPVASDLYAGETPSHVREKVTSILRITTFIGVPVALGIGFGAGFIIRVLYGVDFLGAAPLAFLLTIAGFAEIVNVVAMNSVLGEGRTRLLFLIDASQAAILVSGTIVLVDVFGLIGAGLAMLTNSAAYGTILLILLARGRRIIAGRVFKPIVMAAVVFVAALPAFFWTAEGVGMIVALAIVLVHAGLSWTFMAESERNVFRGILRQVIRRIHV